MISDHMVVQWDEKKTEKVKELITDFIKKHDVTCAESVYQCDAPNLASVELVGEIVDVLDPYVSREE